MNEIPQSIAPGFFPNNPDGTGLVFSYQFDVDGRRTADPAQARWTWRSYLATDIRARVTLDREPLLPAAVRGSLLAPGYACHIDLDDGWMHGDLPDLRHDYSMEAKGLGHFRFALNDTILIDGRKQPLRSVDNVRRMVEGGTRPFRSPAELLEVLTGQSLDGLSADHVRISEELDGIEERIVARRLAQRAQGVERDPPPAGGDPSPDGVGGRAVPAPRACASSRIARSAGRHGGAAFQPGDGAAS